MTRPLEYAMGAHWVWQADPENPQQWMLWIDQLHLDWGQNMVAPAQQLWYVSQEPGGTYLNVLAGTIDLNILAHTLGSIEQVPKQVKNIVKQLGPEGSLEDLYLRYRMDGAVPLAERFQVRAAMVGVGANAFDGAPAVSGIDGYLQVAANRGRVAFQSQDFAMHFPKLYRQGWQFDEARGELNWSILNGQATHSPWRAY